VTGPFPPPVSIDNSPDPKSDSNERNKMEKMKVKEIEKKLRRLLLAEKRRDENRPASESKPPERRVIRRRKGIPDLDIA
jgi:hypothetical protein